jgi:hypothetical protein
VLAKAKRNVMVFSLWSDLIGGTFIPGFFWVFMNVP